MNFLPARVVSAFVFGLAANTGELHARTCSFESLSCLFELGELRELAKPRFELPSIAFSLLPLAESLALHTQRRILSSTQTQVTEPEQSSSPAEFSTRFTNQEQPLSAEPSSDPTDTWPLFEALRRLRGNPHVDGLSRNLGDANSYVALDYSDIFETGRAPYKGSHGVSLFFRHDF